MPITTNELTIKFYKSAVDSSLLYAVIISRYQGQWVFCKHKKRSTYEIPGGHREIGETIEQSARRELYEETGAKEYTLYPILPYSVLEKNVETFGMIYYADITSFSILPDSEMEKVYFFEELPPLELWTYPTLQPHMIERFNTQYKELLL